MKFSKASLIAALAATSTGLYLSPSSAQVTPLKTIAVVDGTQNLGDTRRSISIYDISAVESGSASGVFNQAPLFSIWPGYEIPRPDVLTNPNFEEVGSGMAVNPINGTLYLAAFDSGPEGVPDTAGDTQGDYDLYRFDYNTILADWLADPRDANVSVASGGKRGLLYAPQTAASGAVNNAPEFRAAGTFEFIGGNAIAKVGELARPQNGPFFDNPLEFVNPAQLLFLENDSDDDANPATTPDSDDHQIRLFERVSTSAGSAALVGTTEGGYNGGTTQSWQSRTLTPNGLGLDQPGDRLSEASVMRLVQLDNGTIGVWVNDREGSGTTGGDAVAFYEIDLVAGTATAKEQQVGTAPFGDTFVFDEDPTVNAGSNDGDLQHLFVDTAGNLVMIENGFGTTVNVTPHEPKVIGREVTDYNAPDSDGNSANEITFGGWTLAQVPGQSPDDDTDTLDARFVTYDKGSGLLYFLDSDSGSSPNVVGDVYVFNPATGTIVYSEQNAANHFFLSNGNRVFLRGDANNDGIFTADDIDAFFAAGNDSTLGGTVSVATGEEWFDLTGDLALNTTPGATGSDIDELVLEIAGTFYGDANLDGQVDGFDFDILAQAFSTQVSSWSFGDFTGDGTVDGFDFDLLAQNFGLGTGSSLVGLAATAQFISENAEYSEFASLVPEPSAALTLLGLGGLTLRRRARKA